LLAGPTARMVGRGGITVAAETAGMSRNTVIVGTKAPGAGEDSPGSPSVVGVLLHEADYSLQANAQPNEDDQHADRNGQFERIDNLAGDSGHPAGEPVISADCNKTELVNRREANTGREWHAEANQGRVDVHDVPDNNIPRGRRLRYARLPSPPRGRSRSAMTTIPLRSS